MSTPIVLDLWLIEQAFALTKRTDREYIYKFEPRFSSRGYWNSTERLSRTAIRSEFGWRRQHVPVRVLTKEVTHNLMDSSGIYN